MPREDMPLFIADLSSFTKGLRESLSDQTALPGHQTMMGLVVKAAGFRNVQHFKSAAQIAKASRPVKPAKRVSRAVQCFDDAGRMLRWPTQTGVQKLCMWVFWSRIPARQGLSEKAVNAILKAGSSFGDHVQIRRSLIEHGLVEREVDGSVYHRIEQAPPAEALEMIRQVRPLTDQGV